METDWCLFNDTVLLAGSCQQLIECSPLFNLKRNSHPGFYHILKCVAYNNLICILVNVVAGFLYQSLSEGWRHCQVCRCKTTSSYTVSSSDLCVVKTCQLLILLDITPEKMGNTFLFRSYETKRPLTVLSVPPISCYNFKLTNSYKKVLTTQRSFWDKPFFSFFYCSSSDLLVH